MFRLFFQFFGGFGALAADFGPAGDLGERFGEFAQMGGDIDLLRADGAARTAADAGRGLFFGRQRFDDHCGVGRGRVADVVVDRE